MSLKYSDVKLYDDEHIKEISSKKTCHSPGKRITYLGYCIAKIKMPTELNLKLIKAIWSTLTEKVKKMALSVYCITYPQNSMFFVLHLKIINTFFEKYMHLIVIFKIKVGQAVLKLLIQTTFWLFWSIT